MTYKTEVFKMAFEIDNDFESTVQIKVIGVGGGGGNAVNNDRTGYAGCRVYRS